MGREKSQEGRHLGKTQKQPVYSRRGLTETGFPYAEEAHLREQTPYGPYWDELGLGGAKKVALLTRRSWHAPKEGQEWKSDKTILGRRDREREDEDGDTVRWDQSMSFTRKRTIHMPQPLGHIHFSSE